LKMRRLHIEPTPSGENMVMLISGEADLACAEDLAKAFGAALAGGEPLIVDCSQITFMDSTGLKVLIEARQLAQRCHISFHLAAVPEPVSHVLELSGTRALFDIIGRQA
jgi:anti-anti-sigma factor